MSQEKIEAVCKYLDHAEGKKRARALKKLRDYLARGYDPILISERLRSYASREENEKLASYASKLLSLCDLPAGEAPKPVPGRRKIPVNVAIGAAVFLLILTGVVIFLPSRGGQKIDVTKPQPDSPLPGVGVLGVKGNIERRAGHEGVPLIDLDAARRITLQPRRTGESVSQLKKPVKLRFQPGRKQVFSSKIKAVQRTSSNGIKMSEKRLSFVLRKRVLRKEGKFVILGVRLTKLKGNVNPVFLGFPPPGKEVFFEIGRNFSVSGVEKNRKGFKGGAGHYLLPFPLYPDKVLDAGSTWGTRMNSRRFGVFSQYRLEGVAETKEGSRLKISFLSSSESRSDDSIFHVDRKGIFYVNKGSGVPEYLKLHTVSKTELTGTGFPIENEMIVEEILL